MVIAPSSFGRRIPFGFLVEIRRQYHAQFNPSSTNFAALPAYGTAEFNGRLRDLMREFGTTEGGKQDALSNTRQEIDNVRGIMTQNIERVLERGERIDTLVDKTHRLGAGARDFRVRSRGLKRRMWWKNVKLIVLMGIVAVFLIYLFVVGVLFYGANVRVWDAVYRAGLDVVCMISRLGRSRTYEMTNAETVLSITV